LLRWRRYPQEALVDATTSTSSDGKTLLGMTNLGKPLSELTPEEIKTVSKGLAAQMLQKMDAPKE